MPPTYPTPGSAMQAGPRCAPLHLSLHWFQAGEGLQTWVEAREILERLLVLTEATLGW